VPGFSIPGFTGPEFELPEGAANFARALQDGIYVAIGFAVLALQRAQVQRVELQKQVEAYLAAVRETAAAEDVDVRMEAMRAQIMSVARAIDGQAVPTRRQVVVGIDRLEEVLPDQARDLVRMLREAARRREQDLRSAVGLDDRLGDGQPGRAGAGTTAGGPAGSTAEATAVPPDPESAPDAGGSPVTDDPSEGDSSGPGGPDPAA
jgi:hypothetical protein